MTGPVEMQTNYARGPQAAEQVSSQSNAQNNASQTLADEMREQTRRQTESTGETKKGDQEELKDSTQQQHKNEYFASERYPEKTGEKKEDKLVEDEYRGHFLDIHL